MHQNWGILMKRKLFLLYGGKSAEHEVSMRTAMSVIQAVDFNKYEVLPVYITEEGKWIKNGPLLGPVESVKQLELKGREGKHSLIKVGSDLFDVAGPAEGDGEEEANHIIFPLLHGPNGEDGTVQGLLEVLNLPYVGNGVLASAVGMDKVLMKNLFQQAGLKQVRYVHFLRKEWEKDEEGCYGKTEKEIGYPCFVKPANLGSSVGINKCKNREDLVKAFHEAFQYDRKIIVEQGLKAREIEIGLLGNDEPECSVAGEIVPKKEFYDYQAKYEDEDTALIIPADLPEETYETIKAMAIKAFKALDCSGLARADFFVTDDLEVYINEINTMPGFTPVSMYPLLWKHSGLSYEQLVERLIQLGLERYREKQKIKYTYKD